MIATLASAVIAASVSVVHASDPPRVGDQAPPIRVGEVIQPVSGGGFLTEPAEGRVLVVEFWATWCGPCIPAMAHLSELADELAGEPVDFISLTPETPEAVRSFLERRPMGLPIATDAEDATFDAYDIGVVPTTIILTPEGTIAARTRPIEITADAIRKIVAGERSDLKEYVEVEPNLEWAPETTEDGEVYAQLVLDESDATSARAKHQTGSGELSADGFPAASLITFAWDIPFQRVDWSGHEFGDQAYRMYTKAPGGDDVLARAMLQAALKVKFNFDARAERREVDAYVLERIPGVQPLQPSEAEKGSKSAYGRGIEAIASPIEFVRRWMENMLGKPVVNETGLGGVYDIEIEWADRETMFEALGTIGLRLREDTREAEFLVVTQR